MNRFKCENKATHTHAVPQRRTRVTPTRADWSAFKWMKPLIPADKSKSFRFAWIFFKFVWWWLHDANQSNMHHRNHHQQGHHQDHRYVRNTDSQPASHSDVEPSCWVNVCDELETNNDKNANYCELIKYFVWFCIYVCMYIHIFFSPGFLRNKDVIKWR